MGVHANLCTPKNGDILVAATQVRTTASSPEVSNRRLTLWLQHRLGRPCVLEHFPAGSNTLAGSCGIGLTRDCTLHTAGLLDVLLPHHLQGHLLHPRAVRAADGLHGRRSGCCHAAAASHRRAAGAHSLCPTSASTCAGCRLSVFPCLLRETCDVYPCRSFGRASSCFHCWCVQTQKHGAPADMACCLLTGSGRLPPGTRQLNTRPSAV
jgi:hypothetical protein